MKKKILVCVIVTFIISMLISSCVSSEASTKTSEVSTKISDMFEYIGFNSETSCRIFYDTETKVMYAVLNYKSIIPLIDENGKPKLWKE